MKNWLVFYEKRGKPGIFTQMESFDDERAAVLHAKTHLGFDVISAHVVEVKRTFTCVPHYEIVETVSK